MNMPKSKISFESRLTAKRIVAGLLVAVQALYPFAASANQYMQLIPVRDLIVTNGESLPVVNVDPSNTSSTVVQAGAAAVKAAPISINFAATEVGTPTQVQTVTLSNLGGAAATLGTLSVNNQFHVSSNCDGVVLPALGTCQVNVQYAPTQLALGGILGAVIVPVTSGTSNAQLYIGMLGFATTPANGNVPGATLGGFGASDPALTISSSGIAQIAFGQALINQENVQKTFTLRSSGSAPLVLSSIDLSGSVAYSVTSNCPSTIAVGASCTVTAKFAPSALGSQNAVLTVHSNSIADNSVPVSLSGRGVSSATFEVSASQLNFGAVDVGSVGSQSVGILNTGDADLETPTVTTTGSFFSSSHDCPASLPPGESCTATVDFTPTAPANIRGSLSIHFANSSTSATVLLGQGAGPILFADTTSQTFGEVTVGTTVRRTYTLTNEGTTAAPLTLGTLPANVALSGDCGANLEVNAVCHITLSYSPTNATSLSGVFTVGSTLNTLSLNFSGTSHYVYSYSMSSHALNFGNVALSGTATQNVTIANTGNAPLLTPSITTTGTGYSASNNCATTLAVGATCTVAVSLSVSALQPYPGTLSVAYSNAAGQSATLTGQGQQAVLGVNNASQNFGDVSLGDSADLTYIVSNSGNTAADLSYGALPAAVTRTGTCGATLSVGTNCSVVLTFTPVSNGAISGAMAVTTADSQTTLNFNGNGLALPSFSLSTVNSMFGNVAVGTTPQQTISVNNTGNIPLTTPAINLTGNGFIAAHNCAANLAVGTSCNVTLTFSPTAPQPYAGSLSVGFSNVSAQSAALTGTGQQAVLVADTLNQAFGNVNIGASVAKTYTLSNSGNIVANLSYSALSAPVSRSGTCGATLAAGAACTVVLTCAPTDTSTVNSLVTVSATDTSIALNYTGTGVALPSFALSTSTLVFGNVAANASAQQTVQVNNTGNVPLATAAISAAGAGYAAAHNCPASLAVAANCVVTVTFSPSSAQTYNGALSVNWNGMSAQTVGMTGTGQTAVLAVDLGTQTFASTNIGSSSSKTYTVSNTGNTPATLAYSALDPSVTRSGTCATTLTNGASCTVVLTFAPTGSAPVSGVLTVSATNAAVTLTYNGTGVALPAFTLSTGTLAFGNVAANASSQKTVQVNNTGNVALGTASISASGAGYSAAHNCPASLAVAANCVVTVTFTPTAAQAYNGSLSVNWAGMTVQTVSLSGTGQSAVLTVDLGTQAFGNVNIGASSSKTFTVTNTGNIAASLGYTAISAPISRSGTCASTLAAGASCTVVLTYAPTDTSTVNNGVTVSATNTAVTLNYSGTGVALPSFSLSTATLAFWSVAANSSPQLSVQVSNTGNVPLATSAISTTGAGYGSSHNCPASLAVAANCLVTVTFTPTAPQAYNGSVSVGWTGVASQTATLSGTGQSALLGVDNATQSFGNVNILASSTKTYTVTNSGNIVASLGYTAVSAPVSRGGTCAASLAAGASCTVVLTYSPTSATTTSGSLTVSATNTSVVLNYSGTGVANPSFSLNNTALSYGYVGTGASSQQTVTVTNTGNVALTTPAIGTTGTGYSVGHNCAASLAVAASCVATVTFAPTAVQAYSGSLSIAFANASAQTVTLSGTGAQPALATNYTSQTIGNVNVGSSSSKTFTVTNTGNLAGALSYTALSAPASRSGTCAATLGAGASCTVIMTYAPTVASGARTYTVTVSAPGTSVSLSIVGAGYNPGQPYVAPSTWGHYGNVTRSSTCDAIQNYDGSYAMYNCPYVYDSYTILYSYPVSGGNYYYVQYYYPSYEWIQDGSSPGQPYIAPSGGM